MSTGSNNLFVPPLEISLEIGHNFLGAKPSLKSTSSYRIFTPQTELSSFMTGVLGEIWAFYSSNWDLNKTNPTEWNAKNRAWYLVLEGLKNGLVYGCRERVDFGMFLGNEGACFGFRDYGEYFKCPEIKSKWESRQFDGLARKVQTRIRVGHVESGAGNGLEIIDKNSDLIKVDNKEGILYLVQLKKRLNGEVEVVV